MCYQILNPIVYFCSPCQRKTKSVLLKDRKRQRLIIRCHRCKKFKWKLFKLREEQDIMLISQKNIDEKLQGVLTK